MEKEIYNFLEKQAAVFERLIHLSEQDLDGHELTPRIPKNFLTENGYEESSTPRISFAQDEGGALVGMSANLKGKKLYVHEPSEYKGLDAIVAKVSDVPDAEHTKEVWVKQPVTLKRTGVIEVGDAMENPLKYSYGPYEGETYAWNFESIK